MTTPQKLDSAVDSDLSLLKSWGSISLRSDKPLNCPKEKQPVQPSRFAQETEKYKKRVRAKAAKEILYLAKPTTTSSSHRMESHDAFITEHTERGVTHTDFSMKQLPMSYSQFAKEKRTLHTPFTWAINPNVCQYINTHSLYSILEVQSSNGATKPEDKVYQIQPDEEKIDKLQEEVEIAFKLFYRLTLFHKMNVNLSVECNKLKRYLKEVSTKIMSERDYEYDVQSGESLFVQNVIEEKLYYDHQVQLSSIITNKMIPILAKLKKELYAMEYLSGEHIRLEEDLHLLLQDINRTVAVVEMSRKKAEKESKLSSLGLREAIKLEKITSPQDLYNSFMQLAIQIATLHSEANRFSKLRASFKSYLKGLLILGVYNQEGNKLREMKKKLTMMKVQMEKRVDALVEDGCIRRSKSVMTDGDLCVQEFNIDFKNLIEGDERLDETMLNEMKDHFKRVENFVKLAQIFCEEIKLKKNQDKVLKMSTDTTIYLKQIETVIKGFELAEVTVKKVSPIIEDEYNEDTPEAVEKKMLDEFSELTCAMKESGRLMEDESWTSTKIKASFDKALECVLETKITKKSEKKSIPLGTSKLLSKLAKIIRKRQNEKNKLYVTCKKRIDTQIKVEDVMEFLKSKKLWQAIPSKMSNFVTIQGVAADSKKTVNHKIYCNPELEIGIMKIIKAFVIFLIEVKKECSIPAFIWY